jgi:drug/metabolite transporter (DMT)-like permease
MVFLVGVLAALSLGLGYVLQQRVAARAPLSELLRVALILDLMRRPLWWAGLGAMVAGQVLAGLALQLATVAVVEPLLSTNLLFALIFAGLVNRMRIRWAEIAGAALLSAALGVFIAVGDPRSSTAPKPSDAVITVAVVAVLGAVSLLVLAATRRRLVVESVLLAVGAGLLYGLQDAATRAALLVVDHRGFGAIFLNPWVYVLVGAAAVGILLTQSAFKAARLDYSLPPIAAAEPVVGILLGVTLLGDRLSVSVLGLAVESLCLVTMIAGCVLIARSTNLSGGARLSPVRAERADPA